MSAAGSVLILTHPFDPTADKIVDELNRRGVPLFRCDAADFPERLLTGAELRGARWSGLLRTARRRMEFDDIVGIYYRRPTVFEFHPSLSEDERRWAAIQARMGFGGLLASLDQWLNHPHNIGYAEYKPVQLRQAVTCGLRVPRTLVTNDAEQAQKFVAAVGQAVYKPFGGAGVSDEDGFQHVFTTKVTADQCAEPNISRTMHILQEWVPKHYEVRLTVVDGRFFAARIDAGSEAAYVDWRSDYHSISYSVIETPGSIRSRVSALLASMGLLPHHHVRWRSHRPSRGIHPAGTRSKPRTSCGVRSVDPPATGSASRSTTVPVPSGSASRTAHTSGYCRHRRKRYLHPGMLSKPPPWAWCKNTEG